MPLFRLPAAAGRNCNTTVVLLGSVSSDVQNRFSQTNGHGKRLIDEIGSIFLPMGSEMTRGRSGREHGCRTWRPATAMHVRIAPADDRCHERHVGPMLACGFPGSQSSVGSRNSRDTTATLSGWQHSISFWLSLSSRLSQSLVSRPVRNNSGWSATVTPLASIIGSGVLVSVPLMASAVGLWAVPAVAGLTVAAYLIGGAIRYNIRYGEPLLKSAQAGHTVKSIEGLSHFVLIGAYFITVATTLYCLARSG